MTLKINPIVATIVVAGILILCFAVFKGCKQSKIEAAAKDKAVSLADSALAELKRFKHGADSTENDFIVKNELLNGQVELLENKVYKAEGDLDKAIQENKQLLAKHKLAQYIDTSAVMVPHEYTQDCESCFSKLENTTSLSLRYKSDLNDLHRKWEDQNTLYLGRFKQLEAEKLGLYNKMQSLSTQAKDATDRLKPHGKLYLSWGVMWSPWPIAGGGGLLYQAKNSVIYGAKWYYGSKGQIVETTMSLPLSLRF